MDPRDGSFTLPAGQPTDRLDRVLKQARPDWSWGAVRDLIARGKVTVDGARAAEPGQLVGGGATITVTIAATKVPKSAQAPAFDRARVLHLDRDVVVVDKPSGLATVPWQDAPDALDRRVQALLGQAVHVVQRLDRDTSGVLVFARTRDAFTHLEHQFRLHTVQRRYLALAHGTVRPGTIRSFLADDRGDGLRGSIQNEKLGKEAITHVEVLEALRGATLVACRLETGRTHQIRIHLAERGHMLLGERGYVRDHQGPALTAPRILLHASELGFRHPTTEAPLHFHVPMPDDMLAVLQELRG